MSPVEATALFAELAQAPKTEPETVCAALPVLVEHHTATRRGLSMKGVGGAPDWLGYETALWQLAETLRAWLKKRRDLRGRNAVMDAAESIAREPRYGKGRQNFVLLLGDFGDASFGPALAGLLGDAEVCGQAVKALTKLRVAGLAPAVEALLETAPAGWIRTAARQYLAKLGGTATG